VKPGFQEEGLDLGIEIPAPPVKDPKTGVSWLRYRAQKPIHCDVCVAFVHLHWPNGTHAPNHAVYRRKENGVDTYYCYPHYCDEREKYGTSVQRGRV
jgi:hypothetical protein